MRCFGSVATTSRPVEENLAADVNKPQVDSGEVIGIIRRVLSENGRDYVGSYAVAAVSLLTLARSTTNPRPGCRKRCSAS